MVIPWIIIGAAGLIILVWPKKKLPKNVKRYGNGFFDTTPRFFDLVGAKSKPGLEMICGRLEAMGYVENVPVFFFSYEKAKLGAINEHGRVGVVLTGSVSQSVEPNPIFIFPEYIKTN